jgi:hypothetical protein
MENIRKHHTMPAGGAAPSLILDEGHRLRRSAHSFFRAVRGFLSGSIDSSAFQEVSSGREVSIIFTSNGPLIYRWERNSSITLEIHLRERNPLMRSL